MHRDVAPVAARPGVPPPAFSKIVPNVKSLGLLSDRQRQRFADLGILGFETGTTSDVDLDAREEALRREGEMPPPEM